MTELCMSGDSFIGILAHAKDYLCQRKDEVDALNVFPVPDGDTGTNMYLTLCSAVESLNGKSAISLSEAAEIASMGALMGARGNSGVILSQILRGIAKGFADKECARPEDIALAIEDAVVTAYKAVMKPVEGTILTVLRGMRDAAISQAVAADVTIEQLLRECVCKGNEVLQKTPEMLPVLKEAGVVDAGGQGLVYAVEGALKWYEQDRSVKQYGERETIRSAAVPVVHEQDIVSIENPYDTQLLILGNDLSVEDIRQVLDPIGDSMLVVGSGDVVRVHIHTAVPEEVIGICREYGQISEVTIDNMIEQSKAALKLRDAAKTVTTHDREISLPASATKNIGVISVATGEGLKAIMKNLGCDLVMDGGITMNPSTSDVSAAVNSLGTNKVIFLPNNSNIFLAAKQAKRITGRRMYIVPSRTVPQGISALLSLNLDEDMEYNLRKAGKAIRSVKTGEVTFAARNGKFGRHVFKQGDIIGLIEGKVEIVGHDPQEVLMAIMAKMVRENDSVITVYYGQDIEVATSKTVYEMLTDGFGDTCDVEVHFGGQPLYYYIVSVE